MNSYVLAIDQGTTSTRAILFDEEMRPAAVAQEEFQQHYPRSGWVEHEPEDLWQTTVSTCRAVLAKSGAGAAQVAAIGISNQRETTVVWDRDTGKAVHRAIVWQDRRTADVCGNLKAAGHEPQIAAKTGLLLDPYFSATKIAWILDHVEGARALAEAGRLAFGTVDSYPALAADRRQGACDRCHQCQPDLAVRHWRKAMAPEPLPPLPRSASDAPRGARLRRRFRCDRAGVCSAVRSRSQALPATSRRRPSARPAFRRGC